MSARRPSRLVLGALALALALSACGGDDEDDATTGAETQTETTESAPAPTETETEEVPPPTAEEPTETEPAPSTSPEDEPGGAGDEEPARSLALFTGEGGRITPRVIRVPAFISIRIELRVVDDGEYGLVFNGNTMRVSGGLSSVSSTIDGLRPGAAVVGRPTGPNNGVRIEATAEPGP